MQAETTTDARIAELQSALTTERARADQLERERDLLRASLERLRLELKLMKLRMFVAKSERVDTTQLELEFREKLRVVEEIAGTLGMPEDDEDGDEPGGTSKKRSSTGRRNLRALPLEERRVDRNERRSGVLICFAKVLAIAKKSFHVNSRV